MSTIELALMPLAGREFKLRSALKELVEGEAGTAYDFTVLDAPPSFGLLNLNALMAANDLVVPVLADFLSFHGLKLLFETVQSLEEDLQHVLDHIFIVINGFNASFKLAKEARGGAAEPLQGLPSQERGAPVHQVRAGLERGHAHLRLRPALQGGHRHRGYGERAAGGVRATGGATQGGSRSRRPPLR